MPSRWSATAATRWPIGQASGEEPGRPNDIDDYLLFELRETQRLPVAHIAAPVFDPEGTVRLALTVVAFHDQLTSQDVPVVAKRLVAATTRVARTTWGVTDAGDGDLVAAPGAPATQRAPDGTGVDERGGNSTTGGRLSHASSSWAYVPTSSRGSVGLSGRRLRSEVGDRSEGDDGAAEHLAGVELGERRRHDRRAAVRCSP